jgi:hypothetical protein
LWSTTLLAGTDFSVETTGHTVQRATTLDGSAKVALLGNTMTAQVVRCDVKASAFVNGTIQQGIYARLTNINNLVAVNLQDSPRGIYVSKTVAGVVTPLASLPAQTWIQADAWYTVAILIDGSGRWFLWFFAQGGVPGDPLMQGYDSALATGGALEQGVGGIKDINASATAITRSWDNFQAFVPDADAVIFAGQTLQLGTDGAVREDSAGVGSGPVSTVIGDLPRIPPSGLEDRPVEIYLRASPGDFANVPDNGTPDITAEIRYNPSYLFAGG